MRTWLKRLGITCGLGVWTIKVHLTDFFFLAPIGRMWQTRRTDWIFLLQELVIVHVHVFEPIVAVFDIWLVFPVFYVWNLISCSWNIWLLNIICIQELTYNLKLFELSARKKNILVRMLSAIFVEIWHDVFLLNFVCPAKLFLLNILLCLWCSRNTYTLHWHQHAQQLSALASNQYI